MESDFLTNIFRAVLIFFGLLSPINANDIIMGSQRGEVYLPLLEDKNIAVVANQASSVGDEHLVDYLLKNHIKIAKIFVPEHGFRGKIDAGAKVENSIDEKTSLPLISLYGKHKIPTKEDLANVDIVLFDLQDVGVRFYTYLSTLHNVMKACERENIELIVLDRPNPNGSTVDGEVLDMRYSSFVGLHPVPILYGMTIGEYAKMINGEGWASSKQAKLRVIELLNYTHDTPYELSIKPSPNLPNPLSIKLYPSLALFEGTVFSEGRGTDKQFQLYGDPKYLKKSFSFTPIANIGASNPKNKDKICYGVDLSYLDKDEVSGVNLSYILDAYQNYPDKKNFFLKNNFIDKLAGSSHLRESIIAGKSEREIRRGWSKELEKFKVKREKYLIYP